MHTYHLPVESLFIDDQQFNQIFPERIRSKSSCHWTPLQVAETAVDFLVPTSEVNVLDIGSGSGKFCLAAAHYKPHAYFYGVEQRRFLYDNAVEASFRLDLINVSFIHGNFTQLDFRKFDHFYFYNSFYENLTGTDKIDYTIQHSSSLYDYYNRYLFRQLEQKPFGTRIATYHSLCDEIPPNYSLVKTCFEGLLKFWIRN